MLPGVGQKVCGGGWAVCGWWWCKPILVLSFGFDQGEPYINHHEFYLKVKQPNT